MVHFEGQSGPDAIMPQRLLEYSVLAYRRYKCTVLTYLIYFKKGGVRPQSPLIWMSRSGEEILRFHFKVIELADIDYQVLLAKNLRGLLPLVPLAKDGARREVVELIIDRLCEKRDTMTEEILSVTSLFASLAFSSDEDQEWLKRRFDVLNDALRETPMYKHIGREAREEGLKEGIKEGKKVERQERLASLQRMSLRIIGSRFPSLEDLARKQVAKLRQPQALEALMMQMFFVQDEEEAKKFLLQSTQD